MTLAQYNEMRKRIIDLAEAVQSAKRPDYTVENADVLHNFKSVAARLNLTPTEVSRVYALKHEDAITRMCLNPGGVFSEPPALRVADRINYATLELALLIDAGVEVWP